MGVSINLGILFLGTVTRDPILLVPLFFLETPFPESELLFLSGLPQSPVQIRSAPICLSYILKAPGPTEAKLHNEAHYRLWPGLNTSIYNDGLTFLTQAQKVFTSHTCGVKVGPILGSM